MTASAAKIPVIDISAAGDEAQAKVARELVEAAVEHGFVYIKNKAADIPVEAVDNAFELVRHFPPLGSHNLRGQSTLIVWNHITGQEDLRGPGGGEAKVHHPEEQQGLVEHEL